MVHGTCIQQRGPRAPWPMVVKMAPCTLLMWDLPSHLIVVIVIDYSFHRQRISFQNLSISNYLYLTTFYQMESAKIEFLIILIISWMYSGNNKNDSGLTMAATADFTCAQCTCHVSYSLSACTIVNSCQSLPEKNSWFSTCDILVFLPDPWPAGSDGPSIWYYSRSWDT